MEWVVEIKGERRNVRKYFFVNEVHKIELVKF